MYTLYSHPPSLPLSCLSFSPFLLPSVSAFPSRLPPSLPPFLLVHISSSFLPPPLLSLPPSLPPSLTGSQVFHSVTSSQEANRSKWCRSYSERSEVNAFLFIRFLADLTGSCLELVGSHQPHVCTECSGHTGLKGQCTCT